MTTAQRPAGQIGRAAGFWRYFLALAAQQPALMVMPPTRRTGIDQYFVSDRHLIDAVAQDFRDIFEPCITDWRNVPLTASLGLTCAPHLTVAGLPRLYTPAITPARQDGRYVVKPVFRSKAAPHHGNY